MPPPPRGSGAAGHSRHRAPHEGGWTKEQAKAVLDDPARYSTENPRKLWKRAGLVRGMCVVDVGAGSGFFTFPASDLVGDSGRVYAVDISRELVEMIRERAAVERRGNIEAALSEPKRVPLPDSIADRVLFANVLHHVPPATVREAVRVLRPGGCLVDLDFRKESTPYGPPLAMRLSATAARRMLERAGLRTVAEWRPGPSHYVLMLRKDPISAHRKARRPGRSAARPRRRTVGARRPSEPGPRRPG